MAKKPRDYQRENEYKKKPRNIAIRVEQNKARRHAIRDGRASKGDGTEVHHSHYRSLGEKCGHTRVVSRKAHHTIHRKRG